MRKRKILGKPMSRFTIKGLLHFGLRINYLMVNEIIPNLSVGCDSERYALKFA